LSGSCETVYETEATPMPHAKELDPTKSPIAFFGYELRRYRQEAGLTQGKLAKRTGFALGTISMAETGRRRPTDDFVRRCDKALGVEGALIRIKEMMDNVAAQLPAWFRPWAEIEQAAEILRTWEPLLVPGLLQTADYARVLFMGEPRGSAEKAEMDVAARLERQRILEREEPPLFWVVIDEGVLGRCIGDGRVMAAQLDHLLEVARRSHALRGPIAASAGLTVSVTLRP
jgi:transcriptional regulator with XRE-family HTH domain